MAWITPPSCPSLLRQKPRSEGSSHIGVERVIDPRHMNLPSVEMDEHNTDMKTFKCRRPTSSLLSASFTQLQSKVHEQDE